MQKLFGLIILCLTFRLFSTNAQPVITRQPRDQTASLFADATFSLSATSNDIPPTYPWRFEQTLLPGNTNSALTLTNVQRTVAGSYDVIVSNDSGSITSKVAALKITPFNSLYFFGFSWTDTRGVLPPGSQFSSCYWPLHPTEYYQGRASNGPLWPEFISTNLGLSYVATNNYAFCGAGALDMQAQIKRMKVPSKPELSLFFLWLDSDEPPPAVTNRLNWPQIIPALTLNESNVVSQLYAAGARQIVVQNIFDMSKLPGKFPEIDYFGTDAIGLSNYSEFKRLYNAAFRETFDMFAKTHRDVRVTFVDIFSQLNDLIARATEFGFTKTDIDVLDDRLLKDKSFNGPGASYIFWDQFHPTTKVHRLIEQWTREAITTAVLEELEATVTPEGTLAFSVNHLQPGRDYVLERSFDLSHWQTETLFTARYGTENRLPSLPSNGRTFYRLSWTP